MTTTEHIQRYDPWPHMAHVDNAKTTGIQFETIIATVASVRRGTNGGKWSCKFREDTNKDNRYGWELYEGEPETPISAGDQVEVGLSVKNKDKGGYFYNVNFIKYLRPGASATPTAAGPAARVADDPGWPGPNTSIPENTPQPATREPFDPEAAKQASIEKQVFYKNFNPDAVAMLSEEEQAAFLAAYYSTGMELVSPEALARAVAAFRDAQEPPS